MKSLCTLLLLPHFIFAQISISDARKTKTGKIITVNGRVTAAREFGALSFIQDHTGGIAVYGATIFNIGDSVQVTGELSKYNSMLEIVTDTVKVLATGLPLIAPKSINIKKLRDHEGELVQLNNVQLYPQGLFFYPQRAGMILSGKDTGQYWIDENTDIPGYTIRVNPPTITGVVGRFGDKLQLLPRSHSDVEHSNNQQAPANNSFKVVNWNLEFFGASRYGPSNDALQLANVATVLNNTQADIMALQEISNDDTFKRLLLLMPGYNGRCSNRYSYSFDTSGDFPPQKLCFIYKTTTVKLIREKILFRKVFDEDPSDLFSSGRLPYLLEVDAVGHRLYFVNLHAKSGAAPADRTRRAFDALVLKDTLDVYYNNKNVILLGDLNDDLDQSITSGLPTPYANFTSDDRYHCISKTLTDDGWHSTISYDDVIDHQIISSTLTQHYIEGSIHVVNPFLYIPLYGRTTSDHLPVMSEFDLNKMITGSLTDRTDHTDEIQVFPNPISDWLWFSPDQCDVTVINSTGLVVLKKKGAQSPISLGEYAPGIYTVLLGNRTVRIIKN